MIEALLKDKNIGILPWNHIHSYGERKGLLVMSLGTFYKYAKKLGFKPRYRNEKVYKVEILSPKASYPFQILHMDSTFWRCKNGERVHIHFIQENFSRKILGGVVESSITSAKVVENLGRVIEEYQLQEKTLELYCDDGPENKKDVDAYLRKNNFKIKKIIANYKTKKSNNIIEAWNKSFKRIVLNRYQPKTAKQMGKLLPIMIDYYNNHYLPSLNSLTPNEVAAGKTAEILGKEIKVKRNIEKRLEANRSICCFLKESKDYQNYDCRKNINLSRK